MDMLGIGIGIYSQILDEHLQPGVAGTNPNAIFRIIGMRVQQRNGYLHPDMKG